MTLAEIRARAYAVAAAAIARGPVPALDALLTAWAVRAAGALAAGDRVAWGFQDARDAIARFAVVYGTLTSTAAEVREAAQRAQHHLTIYLKVTALPAATGGFGVEAVLDDSSGGSATTGDGNRS